MNGRKVSKAVLEAGLLGVFAAGFLQAQEAPAARQRGRGEVTERGARPEAVRGGQWNPQQMQERIKETLKANDEEWKVLQPRIEKVTDLAAQRRAPLMAGRLQGGEDSADLSPVRKAMQDLRAAANDEEAGAKDISEKLQALREARNKADTQLEEARESLKEILTKRQEAQLVIMGILE